MRLPMMVAGAFALTSFLLIAACGESDTSDGRGGAESASQPIERPDTPPEFASRTNPFSGDAEAIEKGRELYAASCAQCHGDSGRGDGINAASLDPPVTDFTDDDFKDVSSQYIFWRITEGSMMEPFRSMRSGMTPFGSLYDEEDRWRMVSYIESLRGD